MNEGRIKLRHLKASAANEGRAATTRECDRGGESPFNRYSGSIIEQHSTVDGNTKKRDMTVKTWPQIVWSFTRSLDRAKTEAPELSEFHTYASLDLQASATGNKYK